MRRAPRIELEVADVDAWITAPEPDHEAGWHAIGWPGEARARLRGDLEPATIAAVQAAWARLAAASGGRATLGPPDRAPSRGPRPPSRPEGGRERAARRRVPRPGRRGGTRGLTGARRRGGGSGCRRTEHTRDPRRRRGSRCIGCGWPCVQADAAGAGAVGAPRRRPQDCQAS
jgi:hypothetical protein